MPNSLIQLCLPTRKPDVNKIDTQNFGVPRNTTGRRNLQIQGIVIHCVNETVEEMDNLACQELKLSGIGNKYKHPSLHYYVDNDGHIRQYVNDGDIAWGFPEQLIVPVPNLTLFNWHLVNNNPNIPVDFYTIQVGIERGVLNKHDCGNCEIVKKAEAYKSLVKLIKYLTDFYGIPVDADHVAFHSNIDGAAENECGPCAILNDLICDVDLYCETCDNPGDPDHVEGPVKFVYGINEYGCRVREDIVALMQRVWGAGFTPVNCSVFNFALNVSFSLGQWTATIVGVVVDTNDSVASYMWHAWDEANGNGLILRSGTTPIFTVNSPATQSITVEVKTTRGCVLSRTWNR